MSDPSLPLIPGLSPSFAQQNGRIGHTFDFKNGYAIQKEGHVQVNTNFEKLAPAPKVTVTSSHAPDWLKYDNVVLRFYATTADTIEDRQYQGALTEGQRVRRVTILYYMASREIQVDQDKEQNSGIMGGTLVRRMVIYNHDDKPLAPTAFPVGGEVALHNRVYRIHDADASTREFLLENYGIRSAGPSPVAEDAWHLKQRSEHHAACTPKSQIVAFNEVASGGMDKQTLVRSRQWNKYMGQVLRFWASWKDTSEHGSDKEFIVHYFLADDTLEVRTHNMRDGEGSFGLFVSRQRLPLTTPSLAVDGIGAELKYVHHKDLRVGGNLFVLGRNLVLLRADGFTVDFYMREHGLTKADFTPVEPEEERPKTPRKARKSPYLAEYPPRETASDAKPATPERRKRWGIACMRYQAKLSNTHQQDDIRRFCISYYLADDSIMIHENAVRNSGFNPGSFMRKTRAKNIVTGTYFKPEDFMVGCNIKINAFVFELLKEDFNNKDLLDKQKRNSLGVCDPELVLRDMSIMAYNKRVGRTDTFRKIGKNAKVDIKEFGDWLKRFHYDLDSEKVQLLFKKFDTNGDGVIDVPEFMRKIEEEALLSPRGYN